MNKTLRVWRQFVQKVAPLLCAVAILLSPGIMHAQGLSKPEVDSAVGGYPHYNPETGECEPWGGVSPIDSLQTQDNNAKMIIGVAKTYGLGQQGALIGLMTALVESNLQNYANSQIPESLQNQGWQALPAPRPIGNDHDSVGIMQQRVGKQTSAGIAAWSTFGEYENADSETRKKITDQIMNPAYAAQAFFGTPPDATLPSDLPNPGALRKGLLNKPGDWRTKDPGAAAQEVQVSAFPDRYNERKDQAQSILNRLWEESPPVPLPVPVSNYQSDTREDDDCLPLSGTARDRLMQTIARYAWQDYRPTGTSGAITSRSEYVQATRAAASRGEYIGDTCGRNIHQSNEIGLDCGAFVTRVMRDSGVDPDYNRLESNTTGGQMPYLEEATRQGKYIEVPSSEPLEPGDIAINAGHTYFYVGDALKGLPGGWDGDTASASQCQRAPMAGPSDSRSLYQWYRFVGEPGELPEEDQRIQPVFDTNQGHDQHEIALTPYLDRARRSAQYNQPIKHTLENNI